MSEQNGMSRARVKGCADNRGLIKDVWKEGGHFSSVLWRHVALYGLTQFHADLQACGSDTNRSPRFLLHIGRLFSHLCVSF